jgi:hypothetical protein
METKKAGRLGKRMGANESGEARTEVRAKEWVRKE